MTGNAILDAISSEWERNGMKMDADHVYTDKHGNVYPSVSELIKPITAQTYNNIPKFVSKIAMERGTNVHRCIEAWDDMGIDTSDEETKPYLEAWKEYRSDKTDRLLASEIPVVNMEADVPYCGTIDKLYYNHPFDVLYILDIKTGAKPNIKAWGAQMALYLNALHYTDVEFAKVLHIHDGKWVEYTFYHDDTLVSALWDIYKYMTKGTCD